MFNSKSNTPAKNRTYFTSRYTVHLTMKKNTRHSHGNGDENDSRFANRAQGDPGPGNEAASPTDTQKVLQFKCSSNLARREEEASLSAEELDLLKACQTKSELEEFLETCGRPMVRLLELYLKECFHLHIFSRKLKSPKSLFLKRSLLLDIVRKPSLLRGDCGFNNNTVSNFCTGASIFLKKYGREMLIWIRNPHALDRL